MSENYITYFYVMILLCRFTLEVRSNKDDVQFLMLIAAHSFLKCQANNFLIVEVMNCQTQENGNDFGLFAIFLMQQFYAMILIQI